MCLLECGPTDVGYDDVLQIRRWLGLLEGPIDLAYRHDAAAARATRTSSTRGRRCSAGCSSHNTMIWFKPFPGDWQDWVDRGREGWEPDEMEPYYEPHPRPARDRRREGSQRDPRTTGSRPAATRSACRRTPTGTRRRSATAPASSTSATTPRPASARRLASMYLHPIMDRPEPDDADRVARGAARVSGSAPPPCTCSATAARDRSRRRSARSSSRAARSTRRGCCCSRASGRADDLEQLGIDVVHDLPGVGENLIDHPESIIIWKLKPADGARGRDGRRLRACS